MKVTVALMECFGVDRALIGDLVESSSDRRSLWLWWQAIGAIMVAFGRDVAQHPIVVGRAVILGFVLLNASRFPLEWTWDRLSSPLYQALPYLGLEHQKGLMSSVVRTGISIPLSLAIGWLVVRLNKTRTLVAVATLLATVWYLAAPEFWRLLTNAADQPRFRSYLAVNTLGLVAFTLSLLAGAFLATCRADAVSRAPSV